MAKRKNSWLNPQYPPDNAADDEDYGAPPAADDGDGLWAKSEHPPSMGTPSVPAQHEDLESDRPARTPSAEPGPASFLPPPAFAGQAQAPQVTDSSVAAAAAGSARPPAQSNQARQLFSNAAPGERTTTIGPTIVVRGKLISNENLIVRGRIEAEIHSTKDLHLENSGIINADMRVNSVTISGIVVGDIYAQVRVKLAPEARVVGDIYTPRLIVEDGATFRGRVEMDGLEHLAGLRPSTAGAQQAPYDAGRSGAPNEIVIAVED